MYGDSVSVTTIATIASLMLAMGCASRQPPPVEPDPAPPTEPRLAVPEEVPKPTTAARGDVVVLAISRLPKFLTVVQDRVYWSNGFGELSSVATDGGQLVVHHEPGESGDLAGVVTTDGEAVFFATMNGIYRLVPGDVSASRVVERRDTLSVAVDDRYIYFSVFGKSGVWRTDKDGGSAKRLTRSRMAGSLVAANDHLYWNSYSGNKVHRIRRTGGRSQVFARARKPTGLTVSGERVIWGTERAGEVFVKEPRKRARRLFKGARNHDVIASDEEYVYFGSWVPKGKGHLARVPLAGGDADILADELRSPVGIAVWGDAVFVANKGEDTILRISKSSKLPAAESAGEP